jgi:hypothetical protein
MTFGTLMMRLVATLRVVPAAAPYTSLSVERETQFIYFAGSEVYELVDPDGSVYTMISYTNMVDDTLTEADLPGLGSRLELPPGWSFRVRVLSADYVIENQDGVATVVSDELRNTYQLAVPTPVEIDIRPGSASNRINPMSRGVIPVAILGSESFDVLDLDVTTLAFGPDGAAPALDLTNPFLYWLSHWDVDGDGKKDLLSHYRTEKTGIAVGDTAACLTGETSDGTEIKGCDAITTCGHGFEAALVVPPLVWIGGRMRRRRR